MQTTDVTESHELQQGTESEAERRARIQREEAIIAKAEADIDAGLGIEDDELEAWLDELDRNPDAPLPSPRNTPTHR